MSANDVWAVGENLSPPPPPPGMPDTKGGAERNPGGLPFQTLVEHWNGTSWSVVDSPNVGTNTNQLSGVAVVSANDVWAVGGYGIYPNYQTLVEHWNGTAWSVVPSPNVGTNTNYLNGVAVVSANNVWTVGYYSNGSTQQTLVEHYTSQCVTPTAIINGHLTWQGITQPDIRNTQVTGTLALCNATVPLTYTFTTDSSGYFTVTTNLPDGTYHWYTKGGRHVSSSSPTDGAHLVISGGHASQEFGTQLGGDTNGDNIVSSTDFTALKNQFGQSGQQSADFDYNQVVTSSDFNILKGNFGQAGHTLVCP